MEADVQTLLTLEAEAAFDIDPIEEMRLRTWARRNYAPSEDRDESWHPIVLDEMTRKDREGADVARRAR
jgi:hypothetical protein